MTNRQQFASCFIQAVTNRQQFASCFIQAVTNRQQCASCFIQAVTNRQQCASCFMRGCHHTDYWRLTLVTVRQDEERDSLTFRLFEPYRCQAGHDQRPVSDCKAVPSRRTSNKQYNWQIPIVILPKISNSIQLVSLSQTWRFIVPLLTDMILHSLNIRVVSFLIYMSYVT